MRHLMNAKLELDKECVTDLKGIIREAGGRVELDGEDYMQVEDFFGTLQYIVVRALVLEGEILRFYGNTYNCVTDETSEDEDNWDIGDIVYMSDLYGIHDKLV